MDWANERWIRLYTRDTGDWVMWPWQTRAIFLFILRKVDRAGTMQLGKGNLFALSAMIGMPSQDVTLWIEPLIDDGCVQIRDGVLCVPNFREAQETQQTDKARQQASRERARSRALSGAESHGLSHAVTLGHTESPLDKTRQEETDERESDAREARTEPRSQTKLKSVPPLPPDPPEATATQPKAADGQILGNDPHGQGAAVASGESGYDLALRVWSEMWATKYKRPYEFNTRGGVGSEDSVLQAVGAMAVARGAGAEAYLRHKVKSFLADPGDRQWLKERSHPLRSLQRDWAGYGEPQSASRMVPRRPKPDEAPPVSTAENGARADAMAKMLKIGGGGT